MALRPAQPDDVRPLAELWALAFPGEHSVADRVRILEQGGPYGGLETAWVEEEGGRIVGAFRALRLTEYLAGTPLPMLGLASVAVSPSARRRGLGRRLCRHALRVGRERGDVVSILFPFRPAFYHALGWGLVGELHRYLFRPESLTQFGDPNDVRIAGPEDRTSIAECYARVAPRSNGPIQRSERAWANHLDARGVHAFVYDDGGGVRGYLLAGYGRSRAPEQRVLHIRELIAEDDAAYRGLLGWIAAQRDQWRRVRYDARRDESFGHRLSDPRPPGFRPARALYFPTARLLRGPMLRVLDVPAALSARTGWGGEPGIALTLEIEVHDPELPENRGPWHLSIEEHGARVHPRGGTGADARLATDAATFAQIYAGELLPTTAARLGLAEIQGVPEALDRAFRVSQPFWLLDEF